MGAIPSIILPSGTNYGPIQPPGTWTDQSGTTRGTILRARILEGEVSAPVAWHRNRPKFQAVRTTTKTDMTTSAWTAIPLDLELVDSHGGHSDTTNTDRWYAPDTSVATSDANYYLAFGYVPWGTSNAAQVFAAGISKTGSTPREGTMSPRPAGHDVICMVADLFLLDGNANDYLSLQGWHNHGSNATVAASSHVASLNVRCVSAGAGTVSALPAVPHTWLPTDLITGSAVGTDKVPLNTEIRDRVRFMHYVPVARLTSETSAQTIPTGTGTWTSIAFPTQNIDTYTGWSSGANTLYTFPRDGLYFVYGQAGLLSTNAGAGTYVAARLRHNILAGGSADYYGNVTVPPTTATNGTTVAAHSLIRAVAGDSVALQANHNLGASKTVKSSAGGACRLIAAWMAR
jgi:hypothetical protein